MKSKIIALFAMICCVGSGFAQFKLPKALIFANVNYASPANEKFNVSNRGAWGGEAGLGLGFGKTLVTGTVGYQVFGVKINNLGGDLQVIPLKAGIRQYVALGKVFFLGNVGTALQSFKDITNNRIQTNNLMWEGGVGVKLIGLELQGTYSGWQHPMGTIGNATMLNVKLGWSFKL